MVKIWIVKPNIPEDWIFDGVEIISGKRSIDSLVSRFKSKKVNFFQQVDINTNDDGSNFLNELSKGL